jgi:hypothetical protein
MHIQAAAIHAFRAYAHMAGELLYSNMVTTYQSLFLPAVRSHEF